MAHGQRLPYRAHVGPSSHLAGTPELGSGEACDTGETAKPAYCNWRMTFVFEGEDAILVDYQDYH